MPRYLPSVIVAVVGLGAVTGGTLLYRARRLPTLKLSAEQTVKARERMEGPHVRGQSDAPVTVEEFADLQCPPCAALSEPIAQLEKTYHGRLRVVFRHFPNAIHAHAREAALAAEAAGLQGRFWEMHDLLYREQAIWSRAAIVRTLFEAYAGTLGLDPRRFNQDLDGEPVKARVDADAKRGTQLGVTTTPTIFVNAVAVPPDSLRPDRLGVIIGQAVNPKAVP